MAEPVTDEERGRAFLRRLSAFETDDEKRAQNVVFDVIEACMSPERRSAEDCAALGRVIAEVSGS